MSLHCFVEIPSKPVEVHGWEDRDVAEELLAEARARFEQA